VACALPLAYSRRCSATTIDGLGDAMPNPVVSKNSDELRGRPRARARCLPRSHCC
jgi:hypothetical protein